MPTFCKHSGILVENDDRNALGNINFSGRSVADKNDNKVGWNE